MRPQNASTKPGYQTSEFWFSLLVVLLVATLGSGLIPEATSVYQVIAAGIAVLGAFGYGVNRTQLKREEIRSHALSEASMSFYPDETLDTTRR